MHISKPKLSRNKGIYSNNASLRTCLHARTGYPIASERLGSVSLSVSLPIEDEVAESKL